MASSTATLIGRGRERASVDGILAAVRGGRSSTFVLTGEAGIGKTALLDYILATADDMRVTSVVGIESEVELPFAAVHQLLAPMLNRLEQLPVRQRDALAAAFGLAEDGAPDRFLVGAGVFSLLAAAAEDGPLLCVIDDAHWLDRSSADALAFACRRLGAEPIGVIFARREVEDRMEPLAGLPELRVGALADDEARELLATFSPGPMCDRVKEQILLAAAGNPLALQELPAALTSAELEGRELLLGPVPLSGRLEQHFRREIEALPPATRSLLLLAAIHDPRGDPDLFWRAGDRAGRAPEDLAPADKMGLVRSGTRVVFRHPLIRSAVYTTATLEERRCAHQILGEAADPHRDPDLRAWHLGAACIGVDDDVAAELERASVRARRRGGYTGAAAFLKRAAELTAEPGARAERYLAAAELELAGGALTASEALVAEAKKDMTDEWQPAHAERLLGMVASGLGRVDASNILVRAAKAYEALDLRLARDTYLDALGAALYGGPLAGSDSVEHAARAALAAPKVADSEATVADALLDGFALQSIGDFRRGGALLREAMLTLRGSDDLQVLGWASVAAVRLWDNDLLQEFATRATAIARESGALTLLPLHLVNLAWSEITHGRFDAAIALGHPAAPMQGMQEIAAATGDPRVYVKLPPELLVEAWRGNESKFRTLFDVAVREATARGEGALVLLADYASAVFELSRGNYAKALDAAQKAAKLPSSLAVPALPELVEAASRCGDFATAEAASDLLSETVEPRRTPLGLGLEARSRALLTHGAGAEKFYRDAIRHLERSNAIPQLARAHLVYGEWLRRQRRRKDARTPLTVATEMFDAIIARGFGDRARAELRATGETARPRKQKVSQPLTMQELMIAKMVGEGASNPDVALRLSISRKTVESHLNKIFRKLGVSSRTQLPGALAQIAEQTGST